MPLKLKTMKPSSTALKALLSGILFASLFVIGCNNDKKTETQESTKTDTVVPAPAPVDTTQKVDTGVGHPVTPVN